MKKHNWIV